MKNTLNGTIRGTQTNYALIIRLYLQTFIGFSIGFIFSFSAIVANFIVLFMIIRRKQQRNPFDLVIASLFFTDFSASICCIIFIAYKIAIILSVDDDFEKHVRQSQKALDASTILFCLSLMHILLVTCLRFLSLFWPMKFRQFVTKDLIKALIAATWTLSIIGGVTILYSKNRNIVIGIIFLTSGILVCLAYAMIAVKICILSRNSQSAVKKEYRVLVNSFGVAVTFFGCMLPLAFILIRVKVFRNIDFHLALSFITINFLADPLLYFYFSYWLSKRDEMKRVRN